MRGRLNRGHLEIHMNSQSERLPHRRLRALGAVAPGAWAAGPGSWGTQEGLYSLARDVLYWGFYFVRVIICCSELCFATRYSFGCNLRPLTKVTHKKLYRLAFLCLPWSQTK